MKIYTKLLLFILLIIFSLNSVAFFLYQSSRSIQSSYSEIMERFLVLNDVSNVAEKNLLSLNSYLISGDVSEKDNFQKNRKELKETRERLNFFVVREDNEVNLRNYRNMLDTFLEETELVMQSRESIRSLGNAEHYGEVEKIAGYIAEETRRLINLELTSFYPVFREMDVFHRSIHGYGIGIFFISTLLVIVFSLWFSKGLTEPISRLVQSAHRISIGDFGARKVRISTKDEMGVLGKAFNSMQNNIKRLIEEIQENADLEKKLQEQALKNLEMDRVMKSLELKALQSQINPHFLFNTLNVISKLAYIEGAEKASDLITSVSQLLRYNLGRLDRPTTLSIELNQIKQYFKIQEARFRDRIHYLWEVDESCLDMPIPSLILQPIVENAFIHGIDSLQSGAWIAISVQRHDNRTVIRISDNGVGMTPEKIRQILSPTETLGESREGHMTSLGMQNVAMRLRLYYDEADCILIESSPQKGTTVILNLPMIEERMREHA